MNGRESILDAWAVMAWLKDEQPSAYRVRLMLEEMEHGSCRLAISIINLGEVFYASAKTNGIEYSERILNELRGRLITIPATDELVMEAARLKAQHAISYADAFAAATAISRDAPLVTGDPELRRMAQKEARLKLEWIAD